MTITPEQLARAGTEHAHQCALFCWAALPDVRAKYPQLEWMFAIPNGGERNIRVAGQLKAEGVKAGVLDIFLPVPKITQFLSTTFTKHGLFIEMKVKPNKPTEEQDKFACAVYMLGYETHLCYSWEDARDKIVDYLTNA